MSFLFADAPRQLALDLLGIPRDPTLRIHHFLLWDTHSQEDGTLELVPSVQEHRDWKSGGPHAVHPLPREVYPTLAAESAADCLKDDPSFATQPERWSQGGLTHNQEAFLALKEIAERTTTGRSLLAQRLCEAREKEALLARVFATYTHSVLSYLETLGISATFPPGTLTDVKDYQVSAADISALPRREKQRVYVLFRSIAGGPHTDMEKAFGSLWAGDESARLLYADMSLSARTREHTAETDPEFWDNLLAEVDLRTQDPLAWVRAGKDRQQKRLRGASLGRLHLPAPEGVSREVPAPDASTDTVFWWIREHLGDHTPQEILPHYLRLSQGERSMLQREFVSLVPEFVPDPHKLMLQTRFQELHALGQEPDAA